MVYVIAEAGSSHDGLLHRAKECVAIAKQAGADCVKFQFWSDAEKLAARRHAGAYADAYRNYRVPSAWLEPLKAEADKHGIDFMCTAYLPEDVATVAPYVKHFKVASFEADATDLLMAHLPFVSDLTQASPVVMVSLGMGSDGRVAADLFKGLESKLAFLHCVSAYPAPLEDMDLLRLHAVWRTEPVKDSKMWKFSGLSDHNGTAITAAAAVGAGAKILEVHFRLDGTDRSNPDYATSLNPFWLESYVGAVRMAEKATGGRGLHLAMPSEGPMTAFKVRDHGTSEEATTDSTGSK